MREFIYYSKSAVTSGKAISDVERHPKKGIMQAGRLDIVCNVIIQAFYVSNAIRGDVKLHLIFDGPPCPPVHIILDSNKGEEMSISKKDVAGLIKKMLYKCPKEKGKIKEINPGCFVSRESFEVVVNKLLSEEKKLFYLDKKGKDLREISKKFNGKEVFILGDHEGMPKHKEKFLKQKNIEKISLGNIVLFASQCLVILHNEIDRTLSF